METKIILKEFEDYLVKIREEKATEYQSSNNDIFHTFEAVAIIAETDIISVMKILQAKHLVSTEILFTEICVYGLVKKTDYIREKLGDLILYEVLMILNKVEDPHRSKLLNSNVTELIILLFEMFNPIKQAKTTANKKFSKFCKKLGILENNIDLNIIASLGYLEVYIKLIKDNEGNKKIKQKITERE